MSQEALLAPSASGDEAPAGPSSLHSIPEKHMCCECAAHFESFDQLYEHRRQEHSACLGLRCPHCTSYHANRRVLSAHLQEAHGHERPFTCSACQHNFTSLKCLRRHEASHSEERPHACEDCGKTFRSRSELREHGRSHTGAGALVCEVCGRRFKRTQVLREHRLRHQGIRPYSCAQCPKTFTTSNELRRHSDSHREFSYECATCGVRFKSHNGFLVHKRRHLGMTFECQVCRRKFTQKPYLKRHLERKHPDVIHFVAELLQAE